MANDACPTTDSGHSVVKPSGSATFAGYRGRCSVPGALPLALVARGESAEVVRSGPSSQEAAERDEASSTRPSRPFCWHPPQTL